MLISTTMFIAGDAAASLTYRQIAESVAAPYMDSAPDATVTVSIEQKLLVQVVKPDNLNKDRLRDALHRLYCGDRAASCIVVDESSASRRRLNESQQFPPSLNLSQEVSNASVINLTAMLSFNVSRLLSVNDTLHAPIVNTNLSLTTTLIGNELTVSAVASIDSSVESILVDTALDLPSLLASDLGIALVAISVTTLPYTLAPPGGPVMLPSMPPSLPSTISNEGQAIAGNTPGAQDDLLYQIVVTVVGILGTIFFMSTHGTCNSISIVRMITILSGSGVVCSTTGLVVAIWHHRSSVMGSGAETELLVLAMISSLMLAGSMMASLLLVLGISTSQPPFLDRKAFSANRYANSAILVLAILNFELIQLLPWASRESTRKRDRSICRLFIWPSLPSVPLAGVAVYYIYMCHAHHSMSTDRAVHVSIGLIAAGCAIAAICFRIVARCFATPHGYQAQTSLGGRVASTDSSMYTDISAVDHKGTYSNVHDSLVVAADSERSLDSPISRVQSLSGLPSESSTTGVSPLRKSGANALERAKAANQRSRSQGKLLGQGSLTRKNSFGRMLRTSSFGRVSVRGTPMKKERQEEKEDGSGVDRVIQRSRTLHAAPSSTASNLTTFTRRNPAFAKIGAGADKSQITLTFDEAFMKSLSTSTRASEVMEPRPSTPPLASADESIGNEMDATEDAFVNDNHAVTLDAATVPQFAPELAPIPTLVAAPAHAPEQSCTAASAPGLANLGASSATQAPSLSHRMPTTPALRARGSSVMQRIAELQAAAERNAAGHN